MEGQHLDVPGLSDLVAVDEPSALELAQQGVNVAVVARQYLDLELARPVPKAAIPVGVAPQASKQDARQGIALEQLVVREKARLDIAGASHLRHSIAC